MRKTGGNNAKRLLIVTGYATDITKTTSSEYVLPKDTVPHRLLISVHYYTPWQFAGMTKDESWGKMAADVGQRGRRCRAESAVRRHAGILQAQRSAGVHRRIRRHRQEGDARHAFAGCQPSPRRALSRKMIPVLWDTGGDISRKPPYAPSAALTEVLQKLACALPPVID